jgi:hypothetical protein
MKPLYTEKSDPLEWKFDFRFHRLLLALLENNRLWYFPINLFHLRNVFYLSKLRFWIFLLFYLHRHCRLVALANWEEALKFPRWVLLAVERAVNLLSSRRVDQKGSKLWKYQIWEVVGAGGETEEATIRDCNLVQRLIVLSSNQRRLERLLHRNERWMLYHCIVFPSGFSLAQYSSVLDVKSWRENKWFFINIIQTNNELRKRYRIYD